MIAVGVSSATAAIVRELIDAGAEVHSVAPVRPEVAWLASHTDVDLTDPDALVAAVERIGAVLHAVHLCARLERPAREALLDAARAHAPEGRCDVFEVRG